MVGFGSSLRMARRPGWEEAYLEYETLKLLLSQIEAVYEEEGHRINDQRLHDEDQDRKRVDYREELFLESDSDVAFESPLEADTDDAEGQGRRGRRELQQTVPFTLPSSLESGSSDEEEIDDYACISYSSLSSWAPSWENAGRNNGRTSSTEIFQKSAASAREAFYTTASNEGSSIAALRTPSKSIFKAPMLRAGERSALLLHQTPAMTNTPWYTLNQTSDGSSFTPPSASYPKREKDDDEPNPAQAAKKNRLTNERVMERKARRRQRQKQKKARARKERRNPRHIRVAHAKARAITERFLGLLRAETEKVLLFAQARLGELSDTAGSLRFPMMEDESTSHEVRGTSPYGYALSDGGMHPSGSSSSDEGPTGMDAWSDSSDEASRVSQQRPSGSFGMPTSLMSEETLNRTNRTSGRASTPRSKTRKKVNSQRRSSQRRNKQSSEAFDSAKRQIAHFARLRKLRPIFQRSDQILGEDMLLISAVEEADCYTALGVELLHVFRYILVNLIAVRKITRKHDRLLVNRMLGGYYHRARKQGHYTNLEDAQTLGGRLAKVSGDIYEAHPAVFGHVTHNKLSGVYDRKIQDLANSRTVQVVSSCVALALSEHEISRTRADKLTQLQSVSSIDAPPSVNFENKMPGSLQQPYLTSDEEMSTSSAPSTASTVSLTRLRFTVTSIFAMREAARFKINHLGAYVSRSLGTFTGQQSAGEGLDGCSRETLDFLVSYNPDIAHLHDASTLYEGIKGGGWLTEPVGDILLSSLSIASNSEVHHRVRHHPSYFTEAEAVVAHAVSVVPGPKNVLLASVAKGLNPKKMTVRGTRHVSGLPLPILRLSCVSSFLYMVR